MLAALFRAFAALPLPPLRRAVALSLALAAASFAGLWFAIAYLLHESRLFDWAPLDWAARGLGGLAVVGLSWLLFPAVMTAIMGLFLDGVAATVEALDYPARGVGRPPPLARSLAATMRLMALTIALNLLALPVYLLLPGVNFFVFLALNGYLFGREYFELVASRRLDDVAVREARHRFGWRVFAAGVVIAGLFAVPLVNLVAPVVATAFMVHVFAGLPASEPRAFA